MAYDYQLLNVELEDRIAWVTVDAPPINVITLPLYAELSALSKELKADPDLTRRRAEERRSGFSAGAFRCER